MEKLGVVSNIWAKRLAAGDRFEELARRFVGEGFAEIEIRDGDYLRESDFGVLLTDIERVCERYPPAEWRALCLALSSGAKTAAAIRPEDRALFDRVSRFNEETAGAVFTYALQHPWLSAPDDPAAEERRIVAAKKIAFLLSPGSARMRLVDLTSPERPDAEAAAANLNRYRSLAAELPVLHAVENSRQSAKLTLEIAAGAGFSIAYDEANLFLPGGRTIEDPALFWESLAPRLLVSVHFKQKSAGELLPCLRDGQVDLHRLLDRVRALRFAGDLLLETAAAERPLEEAKRSREYLMRTGPGGEA